MDINEEAFNFIVWCVLGGLALWTVVKYKFPILCPACDQSGSNTKLGIFKCYPPVGPGSRFCQTAKVLDRLQEGSLYIMIGDKIEEQFTKIANELPNILGDLTTKLYTSTLKLVEKISAEFVKLQSQIYEQISSIIAEAIQLGQNLFSKLYTRLIQPMVDFILEKIVKPIQDLLVEINKLRIEVINTVVDVLIKAKKYTTDQIVAALRTIDQGLLAIPQGLAEVIGQITSQVNSISQALTGEVSRTINEANRATVNIIHQGFRDGEAAINQSLAGAEEAINSVIRDGVETPINELIGQFENITNSATLLTGRFEDVMSNIASLTARVDEITGQVTSLTGQVGDIVGTVTNLTGQIGDVTGKVTNLTAQFDQVTGDLTSLTGQIGGVTGEVTNLTGKVNGITGQITDLQGTYDGITARLTALADVVDGVVGRVDAATGQVTSLSAKVGDVTTIISDLTGQIGGISGKVTSLVAQFDQTTGEITALNGRIGNVSGEVTNLTGKVGDIAGKIDGLSGDVSGLTAQFNTMSQSLNNVVARMDAVTGEITSLSGQIGGISGKVTELTGQIGDVTGKVSNLTARIDSVTGEITSLYGKIGNVTGQVTELTGKIGDMSGKITSLSSRVDAVVADVTSLTGRIGNVTGEVTNLTGRIGDVTGKVTNLTGRVDSATGEITSLSGKIGNVTGQVADLTGKIGDVTGKVTSLTTKVDVATGGIENIYKNLNKIVDFTDTIVDGWNKIRDLNLSQSIHFNMPKPIPDVDKTINFGSPFSFLPKLASLQSGDGSGMVIPGSVSIQPNSLLGSKVCKVGLDGKLYCVPLMDFVQNQDKAQVCSPENPDICISHAELRTAVLKLSDDQFTQLANSYIKHGATSAENTVCYQGFMSDTICTAASFFEGTTNNKYCETVENKTLFGGTTGTTSEVCMPRQAYATAKYLDAIRRHPLGASARRSSPVGAPLDVPDVSIPRVSFPEFSNAIPDVNISAPQIPKVDLGPMLNLGGFSVRATVWKAGDDIWNEMMKYYEEAMRPIVQAIRTITTLVLSIYESVKLFASQYFNIQTLVDALGTVGPQFQHVSRRDLQEAVHHLLANGPLGAEPRRGISGLVSQLSNSIFMPIIDMIYSRIVVPIYNFTLEMWQVVKTEFDAEIKPILIAALYQVSIVTVQALKFAGEVLLDAAKEASQSALHVGLYGIQRAANWFLWFIPGETFRINMAVLLILAFVMFIIFGPHTNLFLGYYFKIPKEVRNILWLVFAVYWLYLLVRY